MCPPPKVAVELASQGGELCYRLTPLSKEVDERRLHRAAKLVHPVHLRELRSQRRFAHVIQRSRLRHAEKPGL